MKNKYNFILISIIIIMFNRCEDINLAAPGNNQDNPSVAPAGAIIWDENNVVQI